MVSPSDPSPPSSPLAAIHPAFQWSGLALLSLGLVFALEMAHLPAAALIGPMLAGVIAGVNGATIRVHKWLFGAAQAVIGILIAGSIELDVLHALGENWLVFLGGVVATVAASSYLGWQISRWGVLPGSTAIWGSAPGAASAMVLMAGAFGADYRLVAFMQYLRVMIVAIVAAGLAAFLVDTPVEAASAPAFFPPLQWPTFPVTLLIAAAGAVAGWLLQLPTPFFFGTIILGALLHVGAGVPFQLPPWLLTAAYVGIGWSIGLNFTRPVVRHAARALPQVVGSILLLILLSALVGWLLSELLDIDFLTAYLATSPGGMDAVAIIAAASGNANMSLIMAMQMARFLFVLVFGPMIARMLAKTLKD